MSDAKYRWIGAYHPALTNSLSIASFTLDQTTDAIEFICQVKEAAVITRIGFRYTLRTGTPPTFIASIQGVDGSGNPDGTIKGGGSPASVTFTPPASTAWDATWQWVTLANSYSASAGEFIAIVIAYSSGTIDGSNNSQFGVHHNNGSGTSVFPYSISNNAGVRTRNQNLPLFGYSTASKVFGYPLQLSTTQSMTQATTPDEIALRFMLPSGQGSSYKVRAARFQARFQTTAGSHKVILYDGTTVLQDMTIDSDYATQTAAVQGVEVQFDEATLSTLSFGTVYRLAIQPQGAFTILVAVMTQASNAEFEPYDGGIEFYQSTRTDLGAWTDDTTRQPHVALLVDDWSAGGGLLVHPGMTGGMNA